MSSYLADRGMNAETRGDVSGPASSTANAVARFSGTGGKTLLDSAFIVDNSGHVTSFGGNITFPGTQVPSADANTLDDYEEGTYTPGLTFGGNATGMTFGARGAWYTKTGNCVKHGGALTLTAKGSSTGAAVVTSLAFTPSTTANHFSGHSIVTSVVTFAEMFVAYVQPSTGATLILALQTSGGVLAQATHAAFADTSIILWGGSYHV